jgi:hypothetical protein
MADPISEEHRKEIWEALSDAFIDRELDETDYRYIARTVGNIDFDQLEEIFFNEVAPVCGPNLMTTIPPIWSGFKPDILANDIREIQIRLQNSLFARIKHELKVAFYRFFSMTFGKKLLKN